MYSLQTVCNIRPFRLSDYEQVLQVWQEAGIILDRTDDVEGVKRKLERDPDLFLVAEQEQDIVGVVIGAWDGRRGWVYHFATHPSAQKQGIGTQLLDELESRLRAKGCRVLNLVVFESNTNAIAYYEHNGFIARENLVVMTKPLD